MTRYIGTCARCGKRVSFYEPGGRGVRYLGCVDACAECALEPRP